MLAHHVVSTVLAAGSTGKSSGNGLGFLILPLIAAAAYLLFIRPQRTRQKKAVEQRHQIEPGVEVVTTAGLIAHVVATDDETVTLEIAPGVHSRFLRQAVVRVVEPPGPEEPEPVEGATDTPNGDDTTPDRTG